MDTMDLLEAMGPIRDKYILRAGEVRRKKPPRRIPCALAAMLALAILCAALAQTPMGAAAVETVKEAVGQIIDRLFPPKDMIVTPEGEATATLHEALGREPTADVPGFVIYVDTSRYEMTEDAGITRIRPLAKDDSLPPCEIEISHAMGQDAQTAARAHWEGASLLWTYAGEIHWVDKPLSWVFSLWKEGRVDAPREDHYFVDDGQGGSFHLISRYFLEATEGHGTRFAAMLQSFLVVTQEIAAPLEGTSMEDLFAQAKAQSDSLIAESAGDIPATERASLARQRKELWLDTMESVWNALDAGVQNQLMAGQMDWSLEMLAARDAASAQFGKEQAGAEAADLVSAKLLEERCSYLLAVLQGAETVPLGDVPASPQAVLAEFVNAYFAGDTDAMAPYLTEDFSDEAAGYPYETAPVLNTFKNLDCPIRDMASQGCLTPSAEFRETADSDSFTYLSIVLKWEHGRWKVDSYGLEG